MDGGARRSRTALHGFAIRCITALLSRLEQGFVAESASATKKGSFGDASLKESGAGNETRTRDLNLGKVALYQLSYSRAEAESIAEKICFSIQPGNKIVSRQDGAKDRSCTTGRGGDNGRMVTTHHKIIFGFHAVGVRLKTAPSSVIEVYIDASRRDARMRQFLERAKEAEIRVIEADGLRLSRLSGGHGHQGVVARVHDLPVQHSLDDLLDTLQEPPLLLVLDGVTDPHNLGACLRVADGAGAHAVIAPKDHAAGINATVAKVASGAAETVPYFMVTNLARTLRDLQERNIWIIGTSGDATSTLYDVDMRQGTALVLGAEGPGMRQLTRKTCDELVSIPMLGAVESLNVSVASGVCLYEARRQRLCGISAEAVRTE